MSTDYAKAFCGAIWLDVVSRTAACPELPARVLLHAGPPFIGPPCAPILNAAIQAAMFEGLAGSAAEARAFLLRGEIELRAAQDHAVATPLAQVVSASMLLVAVRHGHQICYAPLVEGAAPALRFGSDAEECLSRLRDVGAWILSSVAPLVRREPLAVHEVIGAAVAAGDECHARTAAATEALVSGLTGLDSDGATRMRASPAFVLTILMAAAAAALRNGGCDIEAVGGNGIDFGVRRRGGFEWRRITAQAPRGTRFAGFDLASALPAIGDSAVIDFCGLGGQALAAAPLLAAEWKDLLPADALTRRQDLVDSGSGMVDAARIVRCGRAPLINLAVLDRNGSGGPIGRGFYAPSVDLFW
jgi:Protein of unknown function (DUF1116)